VSTRSIDPRPPLALLERAAAQARAGARPVLAAWAQAPDAPADALELFAQAELDGERRFYAACAARDLELLGLGCAAELDAEALEGPGRAAAPARELLGHALTAAGASPRLVGGFAFEPRPAAARDPVWRGFGNGRLAVPELLLVREGGRTTFHHAVSVRPGDTPDTLAARVRRWRAAEASGAGNPARAESLRARPTPDGSFAERFARAARPLIDSIRAGAVRKVVLAASERIPLAKHPPIARALRALRAAHPGCLTFAQGIGAACFVGSTPERALARRGPRVSAAAVAGTAPRNPDLAAEARASDALRRSPKERAEHAFVVEALAAALRRSCSDVEIDGEPRLLRTGNAQHLYTEIRARAAPDADLLSLLERVHPTPAVAGTPTDAALELIRKTESFDRGWYAGPLGWLEARGDGEFHVALRCGLLLPGELRLFAGAGLVAASDPAREAAEASLKLDALRAALESACAR
jgi:isochorismate synthase